jgi:hypothetical protein
MTTPRARVIRDARNAEGGEDMLVIELSEGQLSGHERRAMEQGAGSFLLPLTMATGGGRVKLMYQTEGYVTFAGYNFHGDLYRMFRAVKALAGKVFETQNMMLRPDRLFTSGDRVFVSASDCGVRMVYGAGVGCADAGHADVDGADGPTASAHGGAYGAYTATLLPVMAELASKTGVTGANTAMVQLATKLKSANPGYEDTIKIIESTERRWNYMQPVGP